MPQLKKSTACFASPIYWFEVENATELNLALARDALAMRANSPGVQRSNLQGWHSESDLFDRTEPAVQSLCNQIREAVRSVTRTLAPKFDVDKQPLLMEGWININGQGGYNTPHTHPGYLWSGCYYVTAPTVPGSRSGAIEFLDPRTNVVAMGLPETFVFAPKMLYQPRPGMMLVFPSYLNHWVYPNEQDEERISIAFNARFGALAG